MLHLNVHAPPTGIIETLMVGGDMMPLDTWTYEQMLRQATLSKDIVTPSGKEIYLGT